MGRGCGEGVERVKGGEEMMGRGWGEGVGRVGRVWRESWERVGL